MAPRRDTVLGVNSDLHDSSAALVIDGEVVAAVEEERFTRRKHDASLPARSIRFCVEQARRRGRDIDAVALGGKPLSTYERILSMHARTGPVGHPALARAIATWTRSKLWAAYRVERELLDLGIRVPRPTFVEHHHAHAAAAFYPSPFEHAAVLTVDGVGEWATSSIAWGAGHRLEVLRELRFPDSVGLFYTAMTTFCGLEANEGESKLMGLAPYGTPRYAEVLRDRVVEVFDDGSIRLDQRWFAYRAGSRMTSPRLADLLDGPAAEQGAAPGQREADIAASAQAIVEEVVLRMARHAHELTGERSLCLAGGVALNCVANARLREDGPFEDVWVQPAAGDAGGAIGAALWTRHQIDDVPRRPVSPDGMAGAALGPSYDPTEIRAWLDRIGRAHRTFDSEDDLLRLVACEIAAGRIVGWFSGRAEFGPRALGHRSILADPRDPAMIGRINDAVKRREGFRPFAPAVLAERAAEWFDLTGPSPYMLLTAPLTASRRLDGGVDDERVDATPATALAARLGRRRSEVSSVTHLDHSARVQTVTDERSPRLHALITAFDELTGCPMVLNTSFNRRGEPIVLTPADAVRCFDDTDIDLLVLEDAVLTKAGA